MGLTYKDLHGETFPRLDYRLSHEEIDLVGATHQTWWVQASAPTHDHAPRRAAMIIMFGPPDPEDDCEDSEDAHGYPEHVHGHPEHAHRHPVDAKITYEEGDQQLLQHLHLHLTNVRRYRLTR